MEVKKESQAGSSQQPNASNTPETAAPAGGAPAPCNNINNTAASNGCAAAAASAANEGNKDDVAKQERVSPPSLKRPREVGDWLLHPPDGSAPIDLRQEAEAIYSAFELSLCRDVVFELHRELHTGVLTQERLWAEYNNPPPKSVPGGDVYGRIPPRDPSTSITCPSCNRAVGAARYAPHLDKCALGSSRGRASRSARSSPQREPFRSSDIISPASKPSSSSRPLLLPSAKPSPKLSSASASKANPAQLFASPKPNLPKLVASAKVPKATVSTRQHAPSRPPAKPPSSSSRAPVKPRPAPPPPPPAVHAALDVEGREPLHILIKLVDGAPVQTYHRVVLSTPRAEKPQLQQPRSPSTRSLGFEDRAGGPPRESSQHTSSRTAVGGSSGGNGVSGGGGGGGGAIGDTATATATASRARSCFSSVPPRGIGVASPKTDAIMPGTSSRNIRQKQQGGGFYDSRLVDSRGGSFGYFGDIGRNSPSGEGGNGNGNDNDNPCPPKKQKSRSTSSMERAADMEGDYISTFSSSPLPPPPLFVSAPRSPSHNMSCSNSGAAGGGAQGNDLDLDRRYLGRAVESADRQILSWHD